MTMKKIIILLSIVAAAISISGCQIDGALLRTEEYVIKPLDWTIDEVTASMYVECNADFITRSVVENGTVSAFYYIEEEGTWAPLPFIRNVTYATGMSTTTTVESIRFEWFEGKVIFVVEDMDARTPLRFGDDKLFRVSVLK